MGKTNSCRSRSRTLRNRNSKFPMTAMNRFPTRRRACGSNSLNTSSTDKANRLRRRTAFFDLAVFIPLVSYIFARRLSARRKIEYACQRLLYVLSFSPLSDGHSSASGATTRASAATAQGSAWTKNGASACKGLLTAGFLGAILVHPAGESESESRVAVSSADSGLTTFKIELSDHITLEGWERYNKQNRPKAIALAGVGDKAVRSENPELFTPGRMATAPAA